jgi:hypothetical protein
VPDEVQNMIVGMREASLTLRKIGDIVERLKLTFSRVLKRYDECGSMKLENKPR